MPRLRLFGKIFLGFWLATVMVLSSWMIANYYVDNSPSRHAIEQRQQGPPHRFMLRTMYELQNADRDELPTLISSANRQHNIEIFLLNAADEDLLGRKVAPPIQQVATELEDGRRRALLRDKGSLLLAHRIYRPDLGELRAVFVFQGRNDRWLSALRSNLWLRLSLAILVSGAVCYLLSRLVTRRVKALQSASRRLAEGDLDTRLQVRDRGGDETDDLARDFNSMAGQLQERMQAQQRLLADVSHELRSPLARLRIACALAQENPERTRDHLERIELETQRLEDLITQLLTAQSQRLELDAHIDLVSLMQQLCVDANFEGTPEGKRFTFYTDCREALVESTGDLLRKSFDNILRNALHHTPKDSEVVIELKQADSQYVVTITDSGEGVPESEVEHIFDAFYRTDTARTRETGGYGLGLSIVHRAVSQHGGRVTAENTDSGFRVVVQLP
ncbi:MAG: ATP-binding protein, partial [Pseudomonadota bacterium]